jgi:hypothetical protein
VSDGGKGGVTLDQARPTYNIGSPHFNYRKPFSPIITPLTFILGQDSKDGLEIGAGEHYCLNRTSLITILPFYYNPP